MVFSSPLFLFLFLPVVLAVYFLLPGLRARNTWLLLASFLFYAWGEIGFIALLLASTLLNFWLGRWLEQSEEESERRKAVACGIVANVGFLACFKYADLAVSLLNVPLKYLGGETPATWRFISSSSRSSSPGRFCAGTRSPHSWRNVVSTGRRLPRGCAGLSAAWPRK